MINEAKRDGNWRDIIEIVGRQSISYFICTNYRYQRDELMSEEACEELRKRTDKEIADAEKKSAIKRKLEQVELEKAKAQDKEKVQAVS
jgi:hypothetical protein